MLTIFLTANLRIISELTNNMTKKSCIFASDKSEDLSTGRLAFCFWQDCRHRED